jgi:hypothetical protein
MGDILATGQAEANQRPSRGQAETKQRPSRDPSRKHEDEEKAQ